jgi:murein L,D-transpeptidase YafK
MNWISFILINFTAWLIQPASTFEQEQKKYGRVRQAYQNKESVVVGKLKENQIQPDQFTMTILAFKSENRLEIHAGNPGEQQRKIKEFEICASSGKSGPKRFEGDWQVPEGFYHVDRFNPVSSYHLALGINYPNASDRILGNKKKPGGQIMIHGACITIGCLPMTNEGIEEIYLYAVKARSNGQTQIPVYIFPAEPGTDHYNQLKKQNPKLRSFWENLEEGFHQYQSQRKPLEFTVSKEGRYQFSPSGVQ